MGGGGGGGGGWGGYDVDKVFFVVESLITDCQDLHFHSYKVSKILNMDKQIIQKSDFATYLPLNFCYACGDENYEYTHVVPKYSLDMYNTF
jgi:hypothetical protein